MYEDDLDYASRRLNNTLVRTADGHPFFVLRTYHNENGEMFHDGEDMITNQRRTEKHKDINLEPVPLGFVNTSGDMVFVARKPMRRDWRQGLCHNNMITYGRVRAEDINLKLLVQPIMKQYPSFAKAIAALAKKSSVAFSRDFGLSKEADKITLCYRQYRVGEVINGVPVLDANKAFLQQHLQEAIG